MGDVHSKETRSYNMSRIRSKNTSPEVRVRKFLFSKGLRFRLHVPGLPGKPDIVLPKFRTVILVNGCFWHGHNDCRYFKLPGSRTDWWQEKISHNKSKDERNTEQLCKLGWNVITIWECELKPKVIDNTLNGLLHLLITQETNL